MSSQFVAEEKSFPYLFVSLTLFIIGLALLGGIWLLAKTSTVSSSIVTNPIAVITHTPTSVPTLTANTASPSSSAAIFTFPTKQLTLAIPPSWIKSSGQSDTHQIINWWLPDNTVIIESPDSHPVDQTGCPEGGCPDMHGATITISDFGLNAFTTPQTWYEGKATKDSTKNASSSATAQSITTGAFLGLPVYCVSTSAVNVVPTPIQGIPSGIFDGTCYLIWKGHVYAFSTTFDDTSSNYKSNIAAAQALLKSIKLF